MERDARQAGAGVRCVVRLARALVDIGAEPAAPPADEPDDQPPRLSRCQLAGSAEPTAHTTNHERTALERSPAPTPVSPFTIR